MIVITLISCIRVIQIMQVKNVQDMPGQDKTMVSFYVDFRAAKKT